MGAVLALAAMAVVGAASAAAAREYPPTPGSVVIEGNSVTTASTAVAPSAAASAGLPLTGGNDLELVWIGAACAGAGALVVARTRRGRQRA